MMLEERMMSEMVGLERAAKKSVPSLTVRVVVVVVGGEESGGRRAVAALKAHIVMHRMYNGSIMA